MNRRKNGKDERELISLEDAVVMKSRESHSSAPLVDGRWSAFS